MGKQNKLWWFVLLILGSVVSYFYVSVKVMLYFFVIAIGIELILWILVQVLRKRSWTILTKQDEQPELSWNGLLKFFKSGYDPELGWIRKPGTTKKETSKDGFTSYSINNLGARTNPGHEKLDAKIACYGDSFTFSRQVNDNETWEWFLSGLSKSNVQNFGVGNYGIDQAFLRLKRDIGEIEGGKKQSKIPKVVVMGVVPSTIIRILAVWKHYHDYGNTFGFKPVYVLQDNALQLVGNPINSENRFLHYQEYLSKIQQYDYFYKNKFRKDVLGFPYIFSLFKSPLSRVVAFTRAIFAPIRRDRKQVEDKSAFLNVLRGINVRFFKSQSAVLFGKKYPVKLLEKIVEEFAAFCRDKGIEPVLLWMPQKETLLAMQHTGIYYQDFITRVSEKIKTIDLTDNLMQRKDLDALFTDDSKYGGHFSKSGNEFIAKEVYEKLKGWKLV